MDSKVKERIVGAVVLVALGVWLIPLVLDGPEEPLPPEPVSGTRLPAAEDQAPIRTETVELEPAAAGRGGATAAGTDTAATEAAPPASTATNGRAAAAGADDAGEDAAAAATGSDTVAAVTGAPAEVAAPEAAAVEPEPAPRGWTVQIGAFSELANARRQAERVDDFGYTASVSPTESGGRTLYRVRVGGFETETQAEAARSSLSAHGFVGKTYPPE